MGVEEMLDDVTVQTPALDIDRARRSIGERASRRARRRATAIGAGAVVAVLVIVATFSLMQPDGDVTVAVVTDGTTVVSPPAPVDVEPGWELMDEAPIPPRVGHVAANTGEEMVVWGGYTYDREGRRALADGAAYAFETGEWRRISSPPISGRGDALAAWTGEEVVILGGSRADGVALVDAAAWNPDTDEWRLIPIPDLVATAGQAAVVWSGDELVLVGGTPTATETTGATEVFALDVATGTLRELAAVAPFDGGSVAASGRSEAPSRHAAFWTGTHVLVATIDDSRPVTIQLLDPDSGEWGSEVVTSVPGLEASVGSVVWTGDALVIENHLGPGAIYRPGSTNEVTEIPVSGSSAGFPAAAVGVDVVSVGDRWLELETLTWHDADVIPGSQREFVSAIAEGGRYFVWGGDACGLAASCVELVDPGPGLAWTPPTSGDGDDAGGPPASPSSASAVLDDALITISVEPIELAGFTVEVGPPVAPENGWFAHELRLTNTADRTVRIDDNRTSLLLGQPPAILVAEPSCGYSGRSDEPDAPVSAGACRGMFLAYVAEPGETVVQEWWAARDLPGLVPGGYGTFHFEKTLEYSVGGADSPAEQHSEVFTITYEIAEISP